MCPLHCRSMTHLVAHGGSILHTCAVRGAPVEGQPRVGQGGIKWIEVGQRSAVQSTQGGLFIHSWKALGRRTGTCQMQLLLLSD